MTIDMERLKKMLLVVLSSNQAGEVMAASSAIASLLKKDGKDIHWLAAQIGQSQAPAAPPRPSAPSTATRWSEHWLEQLMFCFDNEGMITRLKEAEFILSLMTQHLTRAAWQPSVKQRDWLEAIYQRLKIMEGLNE